MTDALRHWFGTLSLRERIMIWIAGSLATIVIVIFGIALPLWGAIDAKQQEYVAALERRARVEARISNITDAPAPVSTDSSVSLQLLISQSAAEAGFALDRANPAADDSVDIAMANARPKALMAWLNEWEAKGIITQELDMKAGSDGTVSVTALLQRSAR